MKTAANPTNECSAATSWGISVISTLWATTIPINAPTPSNGISSTKDHPAIPGPNTVAKTAKAIPIIPYQTALFAFSWLLSPPSARMNKTDEAIYVAVTIPIPIIVSPKISETFATSVL